jgi:hypothetical protein
MPDYKCLECEEIIEYKSSCAKHHLETKHTRYELIGTDVFMEIKSL